MVCSAAPALSHHSNASTDSDSLVALEGTVTRYVWQNPHVYFTVAVVGESGEEAEWTVQTDSTNIRARRGWTAESLASGDRVSVQAHPARDGRRYALLVSIEKAGGVALPMAYDTPQIDASATSLEGIWMTDRSTLASYPGGLAGFFTAELRPTERGAAAQAAYDERSDQNPATRCIGMPTPFTIYTSHLYPIQIEFHDDEEIITIRSEFFDEVRTVYMDGREHPVGGTRTLSGHSIGRWENGMLVVDTTHFADHRAPYQNGVPSGALKHVIERYRLSDDGTRIAVEFTLEDPEYLAEPLVHRRDLIYSPEVRIDPYDCDPQTTTRFLPQP